MRVFLFLFLVFISSAYAETPQSDTRFIQEIPDFNQSELASSENDFEDSHCAPAAVSNSLMWLFKKGYSRLVEDQTSDRLAQLSLANKLASMNYMNTNARGTNAARLLRGLEKFITERGYQIKTLQYQGWRYRDKKYSPEYLAPRLDWIKEGFSKQASVWLNIGWYDFESGNFKRKGGHWVTLVGYGVDEKGQLNENVLIVHDPAKRAGFQFANEYVILQPIQTGILIDREQNRSNIAKGFYIVEDGLDIPAKRDDGILDGAIVLELAP